jgi:hypothetical protein
MQHDAPPGLESFWQMADDEANDEHPLERELCNRLDALARYQAMIADAEGTEREAAVDVLVRAQEREAAAVQELRDALRRSRAPRAPR